jgi:murein DD-endopeptidase MepM/ murein hydrolase activator NlpD
MILVQQPPKVQALQSVTGPRITLSAGVVETGGTLLLECDCRSLPAASRNVQVSFQGQRIRLFPHPAKDEGIYAGLLGVPITASAGQADVTIAWSSGARQFTRTVVFDITQGKYGEEILRVDPRHVRPGRKDLDRIRREQAELKRIYTSSGESPLWRGDFQLPVAGELSGAFGTRRIFNGELQSHHTGVDFRAQTGDPVRTTNSGVVRLAKELFYSGNAVVIDHGAGVFTSYSHLSLIEVASGEKVEKGQIVGLAGATGRATGPHLHWGVKVNSVSVDPLVFIRLLDMLNGK